MGILQSMRGMKNRFKRFYGFIREGAAHKNIEAPRSINRAMPELCFFPPSFGRRCPEGAEVGLGLFSPSANP